MNEISKQHMKNRMKKLTGTPVEELTDDELKEFMAIRSYVQEQWETIKGILGEQLNDYRDMLKEHGEGSK